MSDSDREAAVEALGEHYSTGRLDKFECDEPSARTWSARTNLNLTPLFADLTAPSGPVVVAPPVAAAPVLRASSASSAHTRHEQWRTWHRRPFVPWLLLVIPLAFLLHAPWPIFVAFLATGVLRPNRRWR